MQRMLHWENPPDHRLLPLLQGGYPWQSAAKAWWQDFEVAQGPPVATFVQLFCRTGAFLRREANVKWLTKALLSRELAGGDRETRTA